MEHNNLKEKLVKVIQESIMGSKLGTFNDFNLLNEDEMNATLGGVKSDCPKLNKKGCGTYGVGNCDVNVKLKRKRKSKS